MTFDGKCMYVVVTLQWRCDENRHISDVVVIFLVSVVLAMILQLRVGSANVIGGPVDVIRGPVDVIRGPVDAIRGSVDVVRGPLEVQWRS